MLGAIGQNQSMRVIQLSRETLDESVEAITEFSGRRFGHPGGEVIDGSRQHAADVAVNILGLWRGQDRARIHVATNTATGINSAHRPQYVRFLKKR